ncbi:hypothetical protein D3C72_1054480 [compost metagenome]
MRGTTLASDAILRTGRGRTRDTSRIVHYHLHTVIDLLPVSRILEQDVRHRMFVDRSDTVDGLGQVRPVPYTFVGDQCRGLSQLQRRDLHVALADAKDNRFAREPGLTAGRALPRLRWHQAGRLFKHVQRDLLTQAEHCHVIVQAIDAELVRKIVEIGVIGTHDRRVHVHPAVATVVPVAVLVIEVRELVITGVKDARLRCHDAGVEAGDCHFWLDRRARCVEPAQHTVEQRPVDRISQCRVFLGADTGDE